MIYRFVLMNLLLLALLPAIGVRNFTHNSHTVSPKLIQTVPPFFDSKIVISATPGTATFNVEISSEGSVLSSKFVGGHPLLMESTKAAINQWKFEPVAENSEARKIQLRFFYEPEPQVRVYPYGITLDVKYECPNKTEAENFVPPSIFKESEEQCEVHKQRLRVEMVRIGYGLMMYKKGYLKAQRKYFPNASFSIDGGCVITTRQYGKCEIPPPQFGEVSYCQKCREASAKWNREHKHVKFGI
jgi:Gram-negative bacterial TonB protein C-terminal